MMNFLNKNKLINIALILIILLLFFNVFPYLVDITNFIFKLLLPFLIGFTFAFILLPVVNFLVKHKFNRKLAVFLVVVSFLGIISFGLYLLFPMLIEELYLIIQKIPDYINFMENKINYLEKKLDFLPIELIPSYDHLEEVIINYLMNLLNVFFDVIQSGMSYLITFLMSIVLMIYFLIDFDKIIEWIKIKSDSFKNIKLKEYLIDIKDTMQAYFKGVILVSSILILLSFLSFTIFDVDYAFLLAIIIGITDIIPYIGPYIGGGLAVIVALTTSLEKAIIVLIIIVILQGLESWLITPKIQSKSIKVHPILVLFSLIFFGSIWGVIGMIVAVPLLAIIQTTIRKYLVI